MFKGILLDYRLVYSKDYRLVYSIDHRIVDSMDYKQSIVWTKE